MAWLNIRIGFEGDDAIIEGLEVWKQKWRSVDEQPVELPHPSYPSQIHSYHIYEIGEVRRPVRFAAAELSNGVWGFYVPSP